MKAYTLTLGEAETQLRDLVKRAQSTHRPVVLTTEESAEPMVVLLESSAFEKLRQREKQLFHLQLGRLFQHLDNVQEEWDDHTKRQKFVKAFCSSTRALWDVCPADERGLCVTLRMASRRLAPSCSNSRKSPPYVIALSCCVLCINVCRHLSVSPTFNRIWIATDNGR